MTLKTTPLNQIHRSLGARMVEFCGWDMPIQYAGALPEHVAVRKAVGVFDISHMGEIEIRGAGATALVQSLTCNDVTNLSQGQAQYSALLTEKGTFLDDIVLYKFSETHYLLCVNASNSDRAFDWIRHNAPDPSTVSNRSDDYVQLAVQGPHSRKVLQALSSVDLSGLAFYHFCEGEIEGHRAILSRTGYTGELGYEIYVAPEAGTSVWEALFRVGAQYQIQPIGLAARNTLRLEMKYALYGNDIDESTTPLEAGLGWIVKLDRGDFVGRDALLGQKAEGIRRRLIGFELRGRGIARDGYPVQVDGVETGAVSSGSYSPSLGKGIGLSYLPIEYAEKGTEIQIVIRGAAVEAEVVATPFYKGA